MKFLTETNTRLFDTAILLLRWMVGLILFVAGAGKVFGWFGGMGLKTTIDIFKTNMNIAAPWAYISCFTELIGGFLLIIGLLTRPAAFALVINMLVATVLVGPEKFFMGGAAYPCSLMISSLVVFLTGPMAYSVDAWLFNRNKMQLAEAAI